jgi:hypothetical protein
MRVHYTHEARDAKSEVTAGDQASYRSIALIAPAGLWYPCVFWASGNNSVVECDLAKVEVAGSNPVSRSIL